MRKFPGGRWDLERSHSTSSLTSSFGPRPLLRPKTPAEAILYDHRFAFPLDQDLRRQTPFEIISQARTRDEEAKKAIASSAADAERSMLRDSVRAAVTPSLPRLGSRRRAKRGSPPRGAQQSPRGSTFGLLAAVVASEAPARRKSLAMIEQEATKLNRATLKKKKAEEEKERKRTVQIAKDDGEGSDGGHRLRPTFSLGTLIEMLDDEGQVVPQTTRRKGYSEAERIREEELIQRLGEALRKGDHGQFIQLWDQATWLSEVPERIEFIKDAARRAAGLKEKDEM